MTSSFDEVMDKDLIFVACCHSFRNSNHTLIPCTQITQGSSWQSETWNLSEEHCGTPSDRLEGFYAHNWDLSHNAVWRMCIRSLCFGLGVYRVTRLTDFTHHEPPTSSLVTPSHDCRYDRNSEKHDDELYDPEQRIINELEDGPKKLKSRIR